MNHLTLLAFACAVLMVSAVLTVAAESTQDVRIDPMNVRPGQFLGFGAEWDSRGYDAAGVGADDFAIITERIAWMRLSIARIMVQAKWCYQGEGQFDWDTADLRALYRHLDVCQKLGVTVMLTDWGCEPAWLKCPGVRDHADPKYAEVVATYLDVLLRQKKYNCIRFFSLGNEPNYEVKDWQRWAKGLENLVPELRRRGLDRELLLTGADQTDPAWHRETVDKLAHVLGAYAVHQYPKVEEALNGKLLDYYRGNWQYVLQKDKDAAPKGAGAKPLLVAEAGYWSKGFSASQNPLHQQHEYGVMMADLAVQAVRAGSSTVLAWMLDDDSHSGFTWGMWQNKAGGLKLKPWFYPWSLLCRYFRPNAEVLQPAALPSDIRVLVARQGRDWSFCLVNRGAAEATLRLRVVAGPTLTLRRYVYAEGAAKTDAKGFPAPVDQENHDTDTGVLVKCPAKSVVVLTTMGD